MLKPSDTGIPFAKIVTVLAIAFGIALGMCGLNFLLMNAADRSRFGAPWGGQMLIGLGIIESLVLVVAGPLLVLTVLIWVIWEAISGLGTKTAESQKLFDDQDGKSDGE